jgi:hypothetical protein
MIGECHAAGFNDAVLVIAPIDRPTADIEMILNDHEFHPVVAIARYVTKERIRPFTMIGRTFKILGGADAIPFIDDHTQNSAMRAGNREHDGTQEEKNAFHGNSSLIITM